MNINIICVGKLKEKYWQDAAAEYMKRIGKYCNIRIIELKETRIPANASEADERKVIDSEGSLILSKVGRDDYVIAMDVEGRQLDSPALSEKLVKAFDAGKQTVDFVIGGSLGLSDRVKVAADFRLSFSEMTFPHQLARVMLLEQIYRAFKISNNETYHK